MLHKLTVTILILLVAYAASSPASYDSNDKSEAVEITAESTAAVEASASETVKATSESTATVETSESESVQVTSESTATAEATETSSSSISVQTTETTTEQSSVSVGSNLGVIDNLSLWGAVGELLLSNGFHGGVGGLPLGNPWLLLALLSSGRVDLPGNGLLGGAYSGGLGLPYGPIALGGAYNGGLGLPLALSNAYLAAVPQVNLLGYGVAPQLSILSGAPIGLLGGGIQGLNGLNQLSLEAILKLNGLDSFGLNIDSELDVLNPSWSLGLLDGLDIETLNILNNGPILQSYNDNTLEISFESETELAP